MKIQHTITIDVKDETEAKNVKAVLDGYVFKGEGLLNLDDQIKNGGPIAGFTGAFIERKRVSRLG